MGRSAGVQQKLYRQLDELLPPDVIIASSSSELKMSEIQAGAAAHPERCVIGHPFNPPHLIPLVEVVGGGKTSQQTIQRAMAFYTSIGKKAVRLNKNCLAMSRTVCRARWRARSITSLPRMC
jgi:3-hydroxyacyl-CoA dehydrogenase